MVLIDLINYRETKRKKKKILKLICCEQNMTYSKLYNPQGGTNIKRLKRIKKIWKNQCLNA